MLYKTVDLIQGSQEWMAYRKNRIGGSDAPIIMGASPWTTKYELYREKMDLMPPRPMTLAMERGHKLEPIARKALCHYLGVHLEPLVIESTVRPYLMASLDAISDDGKVAGEIKCPGDEDHAMAVNGYVPDKYRWQLWHIFNVHPDLERLYYFSYHESGPAVIEFSRDTEKQSTLLHEEAVFMECLNTFTEPDLSPRDYLTREDDRWLGLADQYKTAQSMVKGWTEKLEIARQHLLQECGQSNVMGGGIRVMKVARKGTVDYKAIPELIGVDLEPYRKKPIESWRIM